MFKPALPYVKDLVAHVLFYKDHMLTVHAHHGKFHVHAELADTAKKDASDKSTPNLKKNLPDNEHVVLRDNQFLLLRSKLNPPLRLSYQLMHASIEHDDPPPKYTSI